MKNDSHLNDAAQPFLSQVMLSTAAGAIAGLMTCTSMLWASYYMYLLRITIVSSIFVSFSGIATIRFMYTVISSARAKYMALAVRLFI